MRLIDEDVLKEIVTDGKIIIDEDVLECDSIHKQLVYLLDKVETLVLKNIEDAPTVDVVGEIVERLDRDLTERIHMAYHTSDVFVDGQANGLEHAIEIVKEVGGMNVL